MKTDLAPKFKGTAEGEAAAKILQACVHCGFCTATCPTYQELGDERDSPRGRIYLMKAMFEGAEVTEKTRTHLDRCLTCRSCETTCPSGVQYGRLVDIGRGVVEKELKRSTFQTVFRWSIRKMLPNPFLFGMSLALGQTFKPILPKVLKNKIPNAQKLTPWPKDQTNERKMLVLMGCAQSVATPNTNTAAARVLDKLGITLQAAPKAGCCGAVNHHLGAVDDGLNEMRRNIDAWWPYIDAGAEAIIVSASGCGAVVKEYGHLLENDPAYAEKAKKVSEMSKDLTEVILAEDLSQLEINADKAKIAVHIPCTLQHALKLPASVQTILNKAGFTMCATKESHLCCGSAGTYSILQPKLSKQLLKRKVKALSGENPEKIVTANVGCQLHLQTGTETPVSHWIELLDDAIVGVKPAQQEAAE